MEKKFYKVANVLTYDGSLMVDTTHVSRLGKHYNVEVELLEDKTLKVTGERPKFGFSLRRGDYDVNEITESSTHYYRPWPWSKKRLRSDNMVEFKERGKITYQSSNFQIIE